MIKRRLRDCRHRTVDNDYGSINIINVNNITNSTGNRSKPSTRFNDLFSLYLHHLFSFYLHHIQRDFNVCGRNRNHHEQMYFQPDANSSYLFIQCYNQYVNQRPFKDLLITEVNLDHIIFPAIDSNLPIIAYRIASIVVRVGKTSNVGHYVI